MENHPIPQDITGFQFKLIGNMTVRQFIYLAIGAVIAVFFFFLVPIPLLLKIIIAITSSSIGAAFAFLPIDGRPLDVMVGNFFKALFTPTQYIYQKTGGDLSKQTSETSTPHPTQAQPTQFQSLPNTLPAGQITPPISPQTQIAQLPIPEQKIEQTVQAQNQSVPIIHPSDQKKSELENMLAQIQSQKEALEKELLYLKSSVPPAPIESKTVPEEPAPSIPTVPIIPPAPEALPIQNSVSTDPLLSVPPIPNPEPLPEAPAPTSVSQPELPTAPIINSMPPTPAPIQEPSMQQPTPPPTTPEPEQASLPQPPIQTAIQQPASITPPTAPMTMGDPAIKLPIPEAPNLITGIVRDPRGNPLQNIMVEVKDQDGNPVRAFKTNGLGRFASATSLANGKYVLIFEDSSGVNKFDGAQIEAIGNPIIPIEIVSVDPREELRRSLFN